MHDDERKYADLQFHLAKVTLAKAALAGVTYEPTHVVVHGRYGPQVRGPDDKMATKYQAVLHDGRRSSCLFDDELEAAIWALTLLDPQPPARPIAAFLLKPENEQ